MERWPESWAINDTDVAFGRELLQIFEEFLTELYMQGLSTRTINRHKSNLWVLGGELLRSRANESVPNRRPAMQALTENVSEEGGALFLSRLADGEQRSFDATCRKLSNFLPETQSATKAEA